MYGDTRHAVRATLRITIEVMIRGRDRVIQRDFRSGLRLTCGRLVLYYKGYGPGSTLGTPNKAVSISFMISAPVKTKKKKQVDAHQE